MKSKIFHKSLKSNNYKLKTKANISIVKGINKAIKTVLCLDSLLLNQLISQRSIINLLTKNTET